MMTNLIGRYIKIKDDNNLYEVTSVSYDTVSETIGFTLLLRRFSDNVLILHYIDDTEDTKVMVTD